MTGSQQLLLQLLQRALGGTISQEVQTPMWPRTIQLAELQEVSGLAFDALEKLPKEARPDFELLMRWTAETCSAERDFSLYKQHCLSGLKMLEEADIPFVLMKGLLLANLYPTPSHRPIGDVDLLFDSRHYPIAIGQFKKQGATVDLQSDSKHSTAVYEGLNWELHFRSIYFFNAISDRRYRKLEAAETMSDRLCMEAIDSNKHVRSFPPVFRIIYLTAHIQHHLILEEVRLRHIVDWMLLLKYNRTALAIGENQLTRELKRLGLTSLFRALGAIAVQHLGLEADSYAGCSQLTKSEIVRGEYLLQAILDGHLPGCRPYQPRKTGETLTEKVRQYGELLLRCFHLLKLIPREAAATPLGFLINAFRRRIGTL